MNDATAPSRLNDATVKTLLGLRGPLDDVLTFGRFDPSHHVYRGADGLWDRAELAPHIAARRARARSRRILRNGVPPAARRGRLDCRLRHRREDDVATITDPHGNVVAMAWGGGPTEATRWCVQDPGVAPFAGALAHGATAQEAFAAWQG